MHSFRCQLIYFLEFRYVTRSAEYKIKFEKRVSLTIYAMNKENSRILFAVN